MEAKERKQLADELLKAFQVDSMCNTCGDKNWVVFLGRASQPEFDSLSSAMIYVNSLDRDLKKDFDIDYDDQVVYVYFYDVDGGTF